MSDMQLVLKLIAEAQSAIAGLQAVKGEVQETGAAAVKTKGDAQGMGVVIVQAGDQSSAAIQELTDKLGAAQAKITQLGREIAQLKALPPSVIPQTEAFGRAAGEASRQAGMMAAQWNDVVMMALAGQNPMQLAIQQGSQITQAFGPGGAAGALKMVGSGFMAMLSPMNLATYAAIALGTTMVQWLMSSADAAETAADRLKTLKDTVDSLQGMARSAGEPIDKLRKKYGDLAEAIQNARLAALTQQTDAAKVALNDALDQSIFSSAPFSKSDLLGLGAVLKQIDALKAKIAAARADAQQKDVFYDDTADQDALNRLTQKAQNVASVIGAVADQLKITRAQATDVLAAVDDVRNAASDPKAQVAAANSLLVLLQGIQDADQSIVDVRTALAAAIQSGGDLAVVADEIADNFVGVATMVSDVQDWIEQAWKSAEKLGDTDVSAGIRAALGPAYDLAAALWDGFNAANAIRTKNEAAGAAVRRIPGGLDAVAAGDMNWSGGNASRRVTPKSTKGAGGGGGKDGDDLNSLAARGADVMRQLDDALAGVKLKTQAGIMSAAEAADAVTSAKGAAADALAELIPDLEHLGPAGKEAAETWRSALGDLATELRGVGGILGDLSKDMKEGFKAPFADFIAGTKSGAAAWDDFVDQINQSIAQKLSNKFTDNLLGPVLDGFFAAIGFADGGVPALSAYSGQVLSQSTFFAMPGGGLGEMGEAGPEAIMPLSQGPGGLSVRAISGARETLLGLTRAADGKLGVQLPDWSDPASFGIRRFARGGVVGGNLTSAPGGGGNGMGPVTVEIINNGPPVQGTASARMEGNARITTVMIEAVQDAIAGNIATGRGPVPDALAGTYGLNRVGR